MKLPPGELELYVIQGVNASRYQEIEEKIATSTETKKEASNIEKTLQAYAFINAVNEKNIIKSYLLKSIK